MKNILTFEQYSLNEEENNNVNNDKKNFEHLPRLQDLVAKEFFSELKEHVFYWFNYEQLKDKYILEDLDFDDNEVTAWFTDNNEVPEFEYKTTFTNIETNPLIEKVEKVKMMIWIYNHDTQKLLKQTEMELGLKYINAEAFSKFINKVVKRIISIPKNQGEVDDFKKKEKRRLSDNIY